MSHLNGNLPGNYTSTKEQGRIIEPAFSHEQLGRFTKKAGIILVSLLAITSLAIIWVV